MRSHGVFEEMLADLRAKALQSFVQQLDTRERIMCHLFAALIAGPDGWRNALLTECIVSSKAEAFALLDQLKEAARKIDENYLLTDRDLATAMRIVLCKAIKEQPEQAPHRLKYALDAVFPPELAEKLRVKALSDLARDVLLGIEHVNPSRAAYESLKARAMRAFEIIEEMPTRRGTETRMVPCPNCNLEKRCDAKTKRFRCQCGFDSPYPFPPAP